MNKFPDFSMFFYLRAVYKIILINLSRYLLPDEFLPDSLQEIRESLFHVITSSCLPFHIHEAIFIRTPSERPAKKGTLINPWLTTHACLYPALYNLRFLFSPPS